MNELTDLVKHGNFTTVNWVKIYTNLPTLITSPTIRLFRYGSVVTAHLLISHINIISYKKQLCNPGNR